MGVSGYIHLKVGKFRSSSSIAFSRAWIYITHTHRQTDRQTDTHTHTHTHSSTIQRRFKLYNTRIFTSILLLFLSFHFRNEETESQRVNRYQSHIVHSKPLLGASNAFSFSTVAVLPQWKGQPRTHCQRAHLLSLCLLVKGTIDIRAEQTLL